MTASTTGPAVPELEGTLLGGTYRVGKLLGRGGMGAVFEGVQENLGRKVAIKVLLDRSLGEADLARFEREARASAALGHPNIVQVTDFQHRAPEPPFLVMERLVGESLRAVLANGGPLPAPRVASLASQVLDALAAAHRAGLVHRDIKPDNVFLTSISGVGEVVKVLDFGIAKVMGDSTLTASGAMMGSPAYMAPEQATGGAVDARTDLYGVGITMYHALTGRLPYDAKSLPEMLVCILQSPPPPLRQVAGWLDPGLAAVVERAMAKDPAARFASAEEMRAALAPFTGATPFTGPAPTPSPYAPPPAASPYAPSFSTSAAVVATPVQAPQAASAGGGGAVIAVLLGVGALALLGAAGAFVLLRGRASASPGVEAVAIGSAPPLAMSADVAPIASATASAHAAPTAHAPARGGLATTAASGASTQGTASPLTTAGPAPVAATGHAHGSCNPQSYGPYPSADGIRNALAAHAAVISGCAKLACFQHDKSRDTGYDFEYYDVDVDASGTPKNVSQPGDACAALNACMFPILRTTHFGATSTPGTLRVVCNFSE